MHTNPSAQQQPCADPSNRSTKQGEAPCSLAGIWQRSWSSRHRLSRWNHVTCDTITAVAGRISHVVVGLRVDNKSASIGIIQGRWQALLEGNVRGDITE